MGGGLLHRTRWRRWIRRRSSSSRVRMERLLVGLGLGHPHHLRADSGAKGLRRSGSSRGGIMSLVVVEWTGPNIASSSWTVVVTGGERAQLQLACSLRSGDDVGCRQQGAGHGKVLNSVIPVIPVILVILVIPVMGTPCDPGNPAGLAGSPESRGSQISDSHQDPHC